jgi:hypothetical protein
VVVLLLVLLLLLVVLLLLLLLWLSPLLSKVPVAWPPPLSSSSLVPGQTSSQ